MAPRQAPQNFARYSRQSLFEGIGSEGQAGICRGKVAVVGCGGLGSVISDIMVRAGVGSVTVIDRDIVDESNLQRQVLFDESCAKNETPKAAAAAKKLRKINSRICIKGVVADLTARNADALLSGVDIILDGADNFETRFLVNEFSVKNGIPWIYGACVGAYGLMMNVFPGAGPCLRCVFEDLSGAGLTCDTVGVIAPIVHVVASIQASNALKFLASKREKMSTDLVCVDLWSNSFQALAIGRRDDCPVCGKRRFSRLESGDFGRLTAMCGRNSVQVSPEERPDIELRQLAQRLGRIGRTELGKFMLKFWTDGYEIAIFPDGRAIIKGTDDPSVARGLYAKYVGA